MISLLEHPRTVEEDQQRLFRHRENPGRACSDCSGAWLRPRSGPFLNYTHFHIHSIRQLLADAELLDRYREAARNTARKAKRGNIRISRLNLELPRARSRRERIRYQTLVASIVNRTMQGMPKKR